MNAKYPYIERVNSPQSRKNRKVFRIYLKIRFPCETFDLCRTGASPGSGWAGKQDASPVISRRGAGPTRARITGGCSWHPVRNFAIGANCIR